MSETSGAGKSQSPVGSDKDESTRVNVPTLRSLEVALTRNVEHLSLTPTTSRPIRPVVTSRKGDSLLSSRRTVVDIVRHASVHSSLFAIANGAPADDKIDVEHTRSLIKHKKNQGSHQFFDEAEEDEDFPTNQLDDGLLPRHSGTFLRVQASHDRRKSLLSQIDFMASSASFELKHLESDRVAFQLEGKRSSPIDQRAATRQLAVGGNDSGSTGTPTPEQVDIMRDFLEECRAQWGFACLVEKQEEREGELLYVTLATMLDRLFNQAVSLGDLNFDNDANRDAVTTFVCAIPLYLTLREAVYMLVLWLDRKSSKEPSKADALTAWTGHFVDVWIDVCGGALACLDRRDRDCLLLLVPRSRRDNAQMRLERVEHVNELLKSEIDRSLPDEENVRHSSVQRRSTFEFDSVDPLEFARQLSAFEQNVLSLIQTDELANTAWMKSSRATRAPNVLRATRFFNHMCSFFTSVVLLERAPERRAATIDHIIRIGKRYATLNNLSGVLQIVIALSNTSVSRLHATWELVNKRKKFEHLQTLVSMQSNWKTIREKINSVAPPCVPPLNVTLTDVTFLHTVFDDHAASSRYVAHFPLIEGFGSAMVSLLRLTRTPYTGIKPDTRMISNVLSANVWTDLNEQLAVSRILAPPKTNVRSSMRFLGSPLRAQHQVEEESFVCPSLFKGFLRNFSERQKASLLAGGETLTLRKDEIICGPGESLNFYHVIEGSIDVLTRIGSEQIGTQAKIGPGDSFGVLSSLTISSDSAEVTSEKAVVRRVPVQSLLLVFTSNPDIALLWFRLTARRCASILSSVSAGCNPSTLTSASSPVRSPTDATAGQLPSRVRSASVAKRDRYEKLFAKLTGSNEQLLQHLAAKISVRVVVEGRREKLTKSSGRAFVGESCVAFTHTVFGLRSSIVFRIEHVVAKSLTINESEVSFIVSEKEGEVSFMRLRPASKHATPEEMARFGEQLKLLIGLMRKRGSKAQIPVTPNRDFSATSLLAQARASFPTENKVDEEDSQSSRGNTSATIKVESDLTEFEDVLAWTMDETRTLLESTLLGTEDWTVLLKGARTVRAEADATLINEGEFSSNVVFLGEGKAVVEHTASDGTKSEVAHIVAPEVLGEVSYLTNLPAGARVVSVSPVLVYVLGRSFLEVLFEVEPALGARFHAYLALSVVHRLTSATLRRGSI